MNIRTVPDIGTSPGRSALSRTNAGAVSSVRVMIVDDSLTVRSAFARIIDAQSDLCVVHKTGSGELALVELGRQTVDVLLLDLEMPGMGGLAALPKILETQPDIQVLVVSTLTRDGAEHTLEALRIGAADTMLKPRPGEFHAEYRDELLARIRALSSRRSLRGAPSVQVPLRPAGSAERTSTLRPKLIGIGASTGGIHAMCRMLTGFDPDMQLPILVTQHLPHSFMDVFARQLEIAGARRALIATEGMALEPGHIYIAPGIGHLCVTATKDGFKTHLTKQRAASGCMPSVDPMFSSMARATGGNAVGIVLSGMGKDGLAGAKALHDAGGVIVAQDEGSSAVWGMPGAVATGGYTSAILPPNALAASLMAFLRTARWT